MQNSSDILNYWLYSIWNLSVKYFARFTKWRMTGHMIKIISEWFLKASIIDIVQNSESGSFRPIKGSGKRTPFREKDFCFHEKDFG